MNTNTRKLDADTQAVALWLDADGSFDEAMEEGYREAVDLLGTCAWLRDEKKASIRGVRI